MDHAADAHRTDLMTITRHVLNEQSRNPESRGDFTILLSHIVLGCKFVASAVNKAGLAQLIGLAGETNVQGEEQKKLDVLSNEVFVKALVSSGRTCVLVSEEDEEATFVDPNQDPREIPDIPRQLRRCGGNQSVVHRAGKVKLSLIGEPK